MKFKKSLISLALASTVSVSTVDATVIDMDYSGLFTFLNSSGAPNQNTSYPYYGDTTWGYGLRTPITGTLQVNTDTGHGTGTLNGFEFFGSGPTFFDNFEIQAVGDGAGGPGTLVIANIELFWSDNGNIPFQIVLDAAGLINSIFTDLAVGNTYDQTSCSTSCAIPASNDLGVDSFGLDPLTIGPVPMATTTFDVTGTSGKATVLTDLTVDSDDGIGGSPFDNGPFPGHSVNLDFTSFTVTKVSTVPIPASVWLFSSGLLGLLSLTRRKKSS